MSMFMYVVWGLWAPCDLHIPIRKDLLPFKPSNFLQQSRSKILDIQKNPSKQYKSNKCHVSHILLKFGGFKMGDSATITSMRILSPQIL